MKRPVAYFAGTGRGVPAGVMTNHDFARAGIETIARVDRRAHRHSSSGTSPAMARPPRRWPPRQRARRWRAPASPRARSTRSCSAPPPPTACFPSTAVDLQAILGATRAAAFDVSAACTGWLYALDVAEGLIAAGSAETVARRRRREDERHRRLEGPRHLRAVRRRRRRGGAAARVERSSAGSSRRFMRSDGTLAELLWRPGGGATMPFERGRARRPRRTTCTWRAARCSSTPCAR